MRKREKAKHRVDYRHRWPTQQTLIESRMSVDTPRSKWRCEKSGVEWLRRLKSRSCPEPGKSTHPYDTGVGEQESDSGSSSTSASEVGGDGLQCWKLFTRIPHTPPPPAPPSPATPSPAPAPKISHMKDETRPETPKTPVQYLRLLANSRKSPFPRSRTATPSDFDNATVKSTRSGVQTLVLPPTESQPILEPMAESPKTLSEKIESFLKNIFKRRGLGWADVLSGLCRLGIQPLLKKNSLT
ncbi:hypothetical protein F4859DRAFT_512353 [Xylaria cf. heliscus]|nr:hypothetical protein F4859DRAFT_512353 [Xylaria cf. heliscus]